nr:MAG TPA: hypothetical protein [Bacteriophage sp.]
MGHLLRWIRGRCNSWCIWHKAPSYIAHTTGLLKKLWYQIISPINDADSFPSC